MLCKIILHNLQAKQGHGAADKQPNGLSTERTGAADAGMAGTDAVENVADEVHDLGHLSPVGVVAITPAPATRKTHRTQTGLNTGVALHRLMTCHYCTTLSLFSIDLAEPEASCARDLRQSCA